MFRNRLGIESTPEAILRFFMHRLVRSAATWRHHEERVA
jgi:hypothetical protein